MSYFINAQIVGLAGKDNSTRIKFNRHLTVVYGLNGSGKTSLLKILDSAMTGDAAPLEKVPFTSATVQFASLHNGTTYTRSIEKVAGDKRRSAPRQSYGKPSLLLRKPEWAWIEHVDVESFLPDPALAVSSADRPKAGLERFAHRYLPTTRLYVGALADQQLAQSLNIWSGLTERAGLTEESLDKNFADALQRVWAEYSSEVGRTVRSAQAKGLANILNAVMSGSKSRVASERGSLDLEQAYRSVRQFLDRQGSPGVLGSFEKFKARYASDQSLQAVVHDIYSVEREVERALEPQKQLERVVRRLYSGNKRFVFAEQSIAVESSTGEQIGVESLSSGEKHLLRMFVECLSAGPTPILIDEPEISVHIDWQRELVGILRSLNPQAQFIVATHSPEIMSEIPDERLVSL